MMGGYGLGSGRPDPVPVTHQSLMYQTAALILKKEVWGEADVLITALTRDFGKIRLLAQGSRKHGAKLQGHLEPGSLAEIFFIIGRNGYRLTAAELHDYFPAIHFSLTKLRVRAIFLALLDANLLEERDQAGELFRMVTDALSVLKDAPEAIFPRLAAWFQLKFLDHLGVLPSRDSAEAIHIPSLVELSSYPLAGITDAPLQDERFAEELSWLSRRLAGAVQGLESVGRLNLTLY